MGMKNFGHMAVLAGAITATDVAADDVQLTATPSPDAQKELVIATHEAALAVCAEAFNSDIDPIREMMTSPSDENRSAVLAVIAKYAPEEIVPESAADNQLATQAGSLAGIEKSKCETEAHKMAEAGVNGIIAALDEKITLITTGAPSPDQYVEILTLLEVYTRNDLTLHAQIEPMLEEALRLKALADASAASADRNAALADASAASADRNEARAAALESEIQAVWNRIAADA